MKAVLGRILRLVKGAFRYIYDLRRFLSIGQIVYGYIYDRLCGRHPYERPWHFQWAATIYLYRSLRKLLPTLGGAVLDVGCGNKPYKKSFGKVSEYVGIDVSAGPNVDLVVQSNDVWPLGDNRFDVLLSSQVLEHVEKLDLSLNEMKRVLKPGGIMVLSFPFLYGEHGAPGDFRRFTVHWAKDMFPGYEIVNLERQGGIGTTVAVLLLYWFDASMSRSAVSRLVQLLLMPVWIIVSLLVNLCGLLFDWLDRTGAFYSNILLVIRKPS